jgi:glycosyltransferase involved in cell wall biosynthesis
VGGLDRFKYLGAEAMLRSGLKLVHRHLWQRLPHQTRRAILFKVVSWCAPRATAKAEAKGPIIIVGMLRHASGLGAAARACHDALKHAGLPVYGIDLTTKLMHEINDPGFQFDDGRHLLGQGTVFLHVSGPLLPLAMTYLGRSFVRGKHIVAHWFWELPQISGDWSAAIPLVHEICVNTTFVRDAIRPIAGGRPLHVVTHPLVFDGAPRTMPRDRGPFTALVVFNIASSFARKNPCAAIAAFRQAFGDDSSARLVVKYMNADAWPEGLRQMEAAAEGAANIELTGEVLDRAGIDELYNRADVVLSLHRAEGLGLLIAEGMLRGLPAVATNWSGSVDFLTRDTGVPVGYTLVPVNDPQGKYVGPDVLWAEANVDEAAAALRALRSDMKWRKELGVAAAAHAARFFHPTRYVEQVKDIVQISYVVHGRDGSVPGGLNQRG